MSNSNNLPWEINSSLRRNPSTATGASVVPEYFPHRYESRRSIASTSTAGPPPVSPRSGQGNNSNNFFRTIQRNSVGSPWPIPSAPSSPAPGPPPAISSLGYLHESLSSSRGTPGLSQQQQHRLSPLSIPEMGGSGSRAGSPSIGSVTSPGGREQVRTPVQRPGSHLSSNSRNHQTRANMEAEFTQKHALLVEQARLLLAEMKTLQVLGPVHSAINPTSSSTHTQNTGTGNSDDGTNSSVFLQSQSDEYDTSSFLSGSNSNTTAATNTNNTAIYYEQDDISMTALGAILQGKLGSVVSRPPPRPVRAIAREVLSRLGATTAAGSTSEPNDEGEAEVIELLMEDYEAVMGWARSSFSGSSLSSPRLSSSGASSSSASQGQSQTQAKIQQALNDRQSLLEAALPAYLAHLPGEAMMHFAHEKLYSSSSGRARTPSASVHSGHTGTGAPYTNGNSNSNLAVNGHSPRNSALPTQTYANTHTFRDALAIEDIPRRRFLKTEDNYAWDMLELASALESDLALSSSRAGGRGRDMPPSLRNPVTRSFFTAEDVSKILAHPTGRSLGPYPVERRREVSPPPGVRPVSPEPLPQPVGVATGANANANAFQHNLDLRMGQTQTQEGLQGESAGGNYFGGIARVAPPGPSYRPRLYGHDEEPEPADLGRRGLDIPDENGNSSGLDTDWSPQPAPPPPYRSSPEPPTIPQSPASPPPPVPTADRAPATTTTTASNADSSYLPPYMPEPLRFRPYSPPSSPPPVLGTTVEDAPAITSSDNNQTQRDTQNQNQHLPESVPLPVQVPLPRPLPGSYPEEREHENDEPNSRYEMLASPTSVPVPTVTTSSSTGDGGSASAARRSPTPRLNPIPTLNSMASTAGLIQEIASGLAAIPIPSTVVSSPRPAASTLSSARGTSTINDPASGGEYRSALLGNLHPNPASTSATSLPSSPAIVSPTPLPPRPLSTTVPARPISTGTGNGRRQFSFRPPSGATTADNTAPSTSTATTEAPSTNTATATTVPTSWEAREREREEERTKWANNDYLSGSYGVATPPPSGPIPVSSLNAAAAAASSSATNAASSSSGARYSGYFSLGASHRNISLEQSQSQSRSDSSQAYQVPRAEEADQIPRGRWETREREMQRERERAYASLNSNSNAPGSSSYYGYGSSYGYGRRAANPNNPFASSRDPSADRLGAATTSPGAPAAPAPPPAPVNTARDSDYWSPSIGNLNLNWNLNRDRNSSGSGNLNLNWNLNRNRNSSDTEQQQQQTESSQPPPPTVQYPFPTSSTLLEAQYGAMGAGISQHEPPSGIAEMDAGPFELGDAPPRLPELSGAGIPNRTGRSARGENDDDDDAHSREWMGQLSSARR